MSSRSDRRKKTKAKKQHRAPTPQLRTYQGRFGSLSLKKDDSYEMELATQSSSVNFAAIDSLEEDTGSTDKDKRARIGTFYAK